MPTLKEFSLFILFLGGTFTFKILASEHSPGMVKNPSSNSADSTTANQPNGWLRTFFESFFDSSNDEDTLITETETDTINWDETYRTSTQTDTLHQLNSNPPSNGIRVGSICMDNQKQEEVGRGACGGRGGVRYWLYKVPDSDAIIYMPTQRHYDHPQELSPQEILQLDAHNPYRKNNNDENNNSLFLPLLPMGGILQLLVVIILCVTVIKSVSIILKKNNNE